MPTIFDVANAAGVSTAAVSLVINNPHTNRVGAEKRKLILRTVQRLGYTPNVLARGLAQRRTRILGLMVPMRDPIFFNFFIAGVLSGIQSCLIERGYHLMVYSHAARSGKITRRDLMETRLVDGIIFFNTRLCTDADASAAIHELTSAAIPFVMVNSYYGHEPVHYVGVDDHEIGHRAGAYLAGGHRTIALLCGAQRSTSSAPLEAGFAAALAEAGIEWEPGLSGFGEYDPDRINRVVHGWMRRKRPPTAIFCGDDQMAPDIFDALRAEGRRIPEDVAVIGRGDLIFSTHLTPRLTTIRIPTVEMGRRAAELLTDLLNGKAEQPQRILLPTPLIRRESA